MNPLIAHLLQAHAYAHPAVAPQLIETHISWVILAGQFAYKIKKPLELGFLDFSSLEKRHHFCEEEIRLNRRLSPEIYLGVVPVTGTPDHPQMEGTGPVLEWAVKMRAFPADATLDRETEITPAQIDAIADSIAAFHANIALAPPESAYGQAVTVMQGIAVNFVQLRKWLIHVENSPINRLIDTLQTWSEIEGERLTLHLAARKANGYIRECHGDLHLGNIAWVNGRALIFDALEFNSTLRHLDTANEIAFLTMDLSHRARADLAWRLLNRYLDITGDIAGLAALPYYQVYRATVRAMVVAIRATSNDSTTPADFSECLAYLQLADRLAHERRPALILMHGVSGSGKTWLSQQILEQFGGIRLRADVTRKRLFGLHALQNSTGIPGGIYTQEASASTLATLIDEARRVLTAGFLCIVDATFIHRSWRVPFQALAEEMGVAWHIVSLTAPADLLRARITQRQHNGSDASEATHAVLASQLAHLEPFNPFERTHVLSLDAGLTAADCIIRLREKLNP